MDSCAFYLIAGENLRIQDVNVGQLLIQSLLNIGQMWTVSCWYKSVVNIGYLLT